MLDMFGAHKSQRWSHGLIPIIPKPYYPLVNCHIAMEKVTIFNGKIHYKWPFSIAMLVHQRVRSWICHWHVMIVSSKTLAAQAAQASPPWPAAQMSNESSRCDRLLMSFASLEWWDLDWEIIQNHPKSSKIIQNHPKSPGKSRKIPSSLGESPSSLDLIMAGDPKIIQNSKSNQLRPPNPSGLANLGRPGGWTSWKTDEFYRCSSPYSWHKMT